MRPRALLLLIPLLAVAALAGSANADSPPPTSSSPPTFSEHKATDPLPLEIDTGWEYGGGTQCDYAIESRLLYAAPNADGTAPSGPPSVVSTDLEYADPSTCKNSGSTQPLMRQHEWPAELLTKPGYYDESSTTTSVLCMGSVDGTVKACSEAWRSYEVVSSGGSTLTSDCRKMTGWAIFDSAALSGTDPCPTEDQGNHGRVTGWANPVTANATTVVPADDDRCQGKSDGALDYDPIDFPVHGYVCQHDDDATMNPDGTWTVTANNYLPPVQTVNFQPCARSVAWHAAAPDGDGGPLIWTDNTGDVSEWAGQHSGRMDCQTRRGCPLCCAVPRWRPRAGPTPATARTRHGRPGSTASDSTRSGTTRSTGSGPFSPAPIGGGRGRRTNSTLPGSTLQRATRPS